MPEYSVLGRKVGWLTSDQCALETGLETSISPDVSRCVRFPIGHTKAVSHPKWEEGTQNTKTSVPFLGMPRNTSLQGAAPLVTPEQGRDGH